ncbi:E3 ubiquitin-protein ligase rad18 [Cladophialophora chaetospira]|uniref:Postreplication repair E3 ubiquitin-protein ligase RAD18 n=1 Tax=Cladophialophora chaetospira TaxID=386627 RepID=A0AA38X002_9EURO|nr:E3 ubiquitin-protein ligase rad18 [Cladophialophora chaetospira]
MPDQDEFTDSTDWLPTPLAALASLDSSLRCQVCKDFFTTPMMTSCSHTFCSLCIRRYLSQEGRCPACRESDQEIKLRRNWAVEELVANFTVSRKGLLAFATTAAQKAMEKHDLEERRPAKRRKVESTAAINGVERRSTRSQSKRQATDTASQQSTPAIQEVIQDSDEEGSVFEDTESNKSPHFASAKDNTQPHDGLVECPCCHRRMKETLINSHLDRCIQGDSHTPVDDRPSSSSPAPPGGRQVAPPGTIAYSQRKPLKQNDRLPFINYSLFTETKLRQKLKELGIPNHGSKDIMRRRHTEWVNLWNANSDSTSPVTKRDLLRELKVWEDTLGRQLERPTTNSGFMAKDFDRERHVKKQKDNFDDLIQQARRRAKAKAHMPHEKSASAVENTAPEVNAETLIEPLNSTPEPHIDELTASPPVTYPRAMSPESPSDSPNTQARKGVYELLGPGSAQAAIFAASAAPRPAVDSSLTQSIVPDESKEGPQTPSKRFFV